MLLERHASGARRVVLGCALRSMTAVVLALAFAGTASAQPPVLAPRMLRFVDSRPGVRLLFPGQGQLRSGRSRAVIGTLMFITGLVAFGAAVVAMENHRPDCSTSEDLCLDFTGAGEAFVGGITLPFAISGLVLATVGVHRSRRMPLRLAPIVDRQTFGLSLRASF